MEQYTETLKAMEVSFDDPECRKIMTLAHEIADSIALEPILDSELAHIVEGLNGRWRAAGFKDKIVRASGVAYLQQSVLGLVHDIEHNQDSRFNAIEQEVCATGFSAGTQTAIDEYGVVTTQNLYFNGATLISAGKKGEQVRTDIMIVLGSESYIRHEGMTIAQTEQWLSYYFPEQKALIDAACAENELGVRDAESLMGLRDFTVSIADVRPDGVKEVMGYFSAYSTARVNLAAQTHYRIKSTAEVERYSTINRRYERSGSVEGEVFPALLSGIEFMRDENYQTMVPFLHGQILNNDRKTVTVFRMPLFAIEAIESSQRDMERFLSRDDEL